MKGAQLSEFLRNGNNASLQKRRTLVWLSALGLADFAVISLYQSGIVKKLPDLPLNVFDSNKVNAAPDAYQMGAPDATISAVVYAANMVLATWGGDESLDRPKAADYLLAAAVGANAVGAGWYLGNMVKKQQKACIYCIAGACINFAMVWVTARLLRTKQ